MQQIAIQLADRKKKNLEAIAEFKGQMKTAEKLSDNDDSVFAFKMRVQNVVDVIQIENVWIEKLLIDLAKDPKGDL